MNNKTIFLTEEQLKRVYEAALKESLVVNCDFVKMVVKFLDAHFRPVKYDDINADGDVIQPYAIQVLSMDKEPLQTISTDKLIGKLDNKFAHKIKDEKDRHKFFKQVIDDWIHKRISPEGILSVNMIKEEGENKRRLLRGEEEGFPYCPQRHYPSKLEKITEDEKKKT